TEIDAETAWKFPECCYVHLNSIPQFARTIPHGQGIAEVVVRYRVKYRQDEDVPYSLDPP
ncbi:MAG: hypothetical protein ACK6EB_15370, partial [Planctomyces sp.]